MTNRLAREPSDRSVAAGLPEQAELEAITLRVLELARSRGATAAEAAVGVMAGLSVQVRKGSVETLEHQRDHSLSLSVYLGQRQGSAGTADFSDRSLAATVDAALAIARHTSEDPACGLADPERQATANPDLDLFHPWNISVDEAMERALACEAAALAVDPRVSNSDGAGLSTHAGVSVYGNTQGFLAGRRSTRHDLSCVVIASDGQGMQRDAWYSLHRNAEALESPDAVGQRAGRQAVQRLGARQIPTCRLPVLFEASVARSLLRHFVAAVSGGSLYRKASFLLDRLGEPVFSNLISLRECPYLPCALGSAAFDQEGVATRERMLVRDGVLEGYVLDSYSARKLGLETTGNAGGVHNLCLPPGSLDLDGLAELMGHGLLVTEMMGQGVNLVTGDYSRGASGFLVEHGRIGRPVEEITVAGNLKDLFAGIQAVGSDVDIRGGIRCGSLLIDGMTIAGS